MSVDQRLRSNSRFKISKQPKNSMSKFYKKGQVDEQNNAGEDES
jgi:hypothetical protein